MSQRRAGDYLLGWGSGQAKLQKKDEPTKAQRPIAPAAAPAKVPATAAAPVQGGDGGVFVSNCTLEEYSEAWLKLTMGGKRGSSAQALTQLQANALKPAEQRAVRIRFTEVFSRILHGDDYHA
jgi:hypothetical protein